MSEPDAATATKSAFRVEPDGDGFRLSWGDDPLDYIWQTKAQVYDLSNALFCALTNGAFSGEYSEGGVTVRAPFPPPGFIVPPEEGKAG